jgi:glycosyltransferase involved in cell wall biosynthesis
MTAPKISVIIPTYKRPEIVLRALRSLAEQTLPSNAYEVVVVDDGSTYDPGLVADQSFPFQWRYRRQTNQGATAARNNGVGYSQGEILVFMDDDVTVSSPTLAALLACCQAQPQTIILGNVQPSAPVDNHFARLGAGEAPPPPGPAHFTECNTQLLAVKRADFLQLGMLQDPTGGWPNWDDVDFGYRARQAGFGLFCCEAAVAQHWDYALADLTAACGRWRRASQSAARLFERYPDLPAHLPMYQDKTALNWGEDGAGLTLRKIARRLTSTKWALSLQQGVVRFCEKVWPRPWLLRPLYRWIQGGYIALGYREGRANLNG